jgi:hypothetical protein
MTAHWQRHDGFDPRDPDAPAVQMCKSCCNVLHRPDAYCDSCEDITASYPWTAEDEAKWQRDYGRRLQLQRDTAPGCTFDGDKITTREAECLRAFGRKVA